MTRPTNAGRLSLVSVAPPQVAAPTGLAMMPLECSGKSRRASSHVNASSPQWGTPAKSRGHA